MKKILFSLYLLLTTFVSQAQQRKFYEIQAEAERFFENQKKQRLSVSNNNSDDEGEEDGDYNRYKRWEWWAERHLDSKGYVLNNVIMSKLATQKFNTNAKNSRIKSVESIGGNWQNLSNVPYSTAIDEQAGMGRVNCIIEIPGTPDFLVGTSGGGIWRGVYTNLGYNWIPLSDGIPQMGIADIVINPNNINEIYILTGSSYGGGGDGIGSINGGTNGSGGGSSIGILKSTDAGLNWSETAMKIPIDSSCVGFKLIADPTNFNHMVMASNKGIYMTQNAWQTVSSALYSQPSSGIANLKGGLWYDIKFKPNDGNTIYASSTNGIWRSTDGGLTFIHRFRIPNGAKNDACQRVMLGVSPANNNVVYAVAGNSNQAYDPPIPPTNYNTGFLGLYASSDGGVSFQLRSASPNILSNEADGTFGSYYSTAAYALCIAVSPTDANRIFVGSLNVWESTNGGYNWINRSDNKADFDDFNYVHADIHFLSFGSYGNILCGNDGGFFNYTSSNNTWSFLSANLNNTQIYRISIVYQVQPLIYSGRVIYGGSQDNGQHRWTPNGFVKVAGGDGMDNAIASADGSEIVATLQNGILLHSDNYGGSFSEPSSTPIENRQGAWITPLVQHCSVPDLVYVGYKDYYYSTDGGDDFDVRVSTGFVNPIIAMAQGNYSTFNLPNTNVVYCAVNATPPPPPNTNAGKPNWRVYRFENDQSASIQDITSGAFGNNIITSIATDPNNSRYVFVTLGGYDATRKVFFSSNKGVSWTNITDNLPNVPVNCIALKTGGSSGIYIGTDIGVFHRFSYAGGQQWTLYSNKLPNVAVTDIELDVANNEMFIATFGRGIWKSDLYTPCPQNVFHTANTVGQEYYEASGTITSTTTIQGGIGTKVTYNTGNEIVLSDGFFVKEGSVLYAYVSGCGNARSDQQFLRKDTNNASQKQEVLGTTSKKKVVKVIAPTELHATNTDKGVKSKLKVKK
ncbi:WD40/YVTN/BNR-like repeat-containing protein [Emticicia sp. SJ17W-69]|uniref:WD40/YVTN/BNR-like repeat-containing protein n=1 Tax=Emticicia sp. SJ17W-69 TaxID=3421657 RepID=UPI003EBC4BF1